MTFHCLQADAHPLRHLGLGQLVDLVQDEHLLPPAGHALDAGGQPLQRLLALCLALGSGALAGAFGELGTGLHPVPAQVLGAAAVDRRIVCDPAQQRDRLAGVMHGRAFQQAHADIVHHFAGQPGRAEPAMQVVHQFLVVAHQRGHQRQRRWAGKCRLGHPDGQQG